MLQSSKLKKNKRSQWELERISRKNKKKKEYEKLHMQDEKFNEKDEK